MSLRFSSKRQETNKVVEMEESLKQDEVYVFMNTLLEENIADSKQLENKTIMIFSIETRGYPLLFTCKGKTNVYRVPIALKGIK